MRTRTWILGILALVFLAAGCPINKTGPWCRYGGGAPLPPCPEKDPFPDANACYCYSRPEAGPEKGQEKGSLQRDRIKGRDYWTLERSDARLLHRPEAFAQEIGQLQKRGKLRIGLALSGGGLRSNAFQAGFMSGLQQIGFLEKVGHISAVSGGLWAAAAYKASSLCPQQYFSALDEVVRDEAQFFDCEDFSPVPERRECGESDPLRLLPNSYSQVFTEAKKHLELVDLNKGYTCREGWRRMLVRQFLTVNKDQASGGSRGVFDRPLSEVETKDPYQKPILILNGTHDTRDSSQEQPLLAAQQGEGKTWGRLNMPFEMTAFSIGTIVDCGTQTRAGLPPDKTREPSIPWRSDYCTKPAGEYPARFLVLKEKGYCPLSLSHAMAMASAVIPAEYTMAMDWPVPIHEEGALANADCGPYPHTTLADQGPAGMPGMPGVAAPPGCKGLTLEGRCTDFRARYIVSDGGHSENLGALALMERGVDLLIISDDGYDPKREFGDYGTLKKQAATLLGVQHMAIHYEDDGLLPHAGMKDNEMRERTERLHKKGEKEGECVFFGSWQDPGATGAVHLLKPFLYVRVPESVQGFLKWLLREENKEYRYIYNYIVFNWLSFPDDGTLAASYSRKLMFAHYLLGKYIAVEELKPYLDIHGRLTDSW